MVKTTISLLLFKMLQSQGKKVGLIGTLGYQINDEDYSLNHTTPDIIELHEIFIEMIKNKVEYVVMEVSSHALALDRVWGLHFRVAIFTNLTQDHLDFHHTMQNYENEKWKLFDYTQKENGLSVINIDDTAGFLFHNKINKRKQSISFINGNVTITDVEYKTTSSSFLLKPFNTRFEIPLIGKFNLINFTLALCAFSELLPSYNKDLFENFLELPMYVPGRLELVSNDERLPIYVDYAHTPDALENVLATLKPITKGKLYCVFGAGGNRDRSKRPKMLESSLKFADLTIVTSDNPRKENPVTIIRDIIKTHSFEKKFWIERDRQKAIQMAVLLMRKDDLLLIAGKGHETYQIIGENVIHFDDKEEAIKSINKKNYAIVEDSLSFSIDSINIEALFDEKIAMERFEYISTDTRTITDNSIFFALKGERFDGHDYLDLVRKKENCISIVSKKSSENSLNEVLVEDTMKAYGDLAKKYSSLFPAKKIAITGSSGKTSTKEYLFQVLSHHGKTTKSAKNENNQIGLPKTLFTLNPDDDYAILELGTNHSGEIAYLANICQPDIGVITNIGPAHLEFFKTLENIFKEKTALFDFVNKQKIFPADDERFRNLNGIRWGRSDNADYQLNNIRKIENGFLFKVNNISFNIDSPFLHNVYNATIAIVIGLELKIPAENIQKAIRKRVEVPLRMQILQKDEQTIIADCYNANPDSMKAALEFWKDYLPEKTHIAILGDMLELGEDAIQFHKDVNSQIEAEKLIKIISIGKLSKNYIADEHFDSVKEFIESNLWESLPKNSVILLKASHSIHLEEIIKGR